MIIMREIMGQMMNCYATKKCCLVMFEIFIKPDVRSLCLESCHGNRRWGWNLAGAPLVAHDHPRATWTRRPKCLLYPDLLIMLHFRHNVCSYWYPSVLALLRTSLGYKSWLPSQDRSWKKEIYSNTAVVELRIWNIFQVKDGVYNLSGLSKLSLVLKRYDLTSWKKTTWSQNINICNIEKVISSSNFHLLNKVGKTWGLCWVGDLAKKKFCKLRQFVFFRFQV